MKRSRDWMEQANSDLQRARNSIDVFPYTLAEAGRSFHEG